ncbi:uncharacterized protein dbf4b [Odontesthes bonariensis]|uniref:uncharacterized protein dbf4b n=1 Tax=Odontesthes bonariensis TaxID=219752 RepID=UPI003F58649A
MALLEKAIRNNERLQGNSVLSNARSWGVRILYADDLLLYLKQLTRESFSAKHKRTEKTSIKQGSPVVKAAALRSPYLKIEDSSRKYKPLHMQSMTFPALYYSGRYSPFESPPPPRFEKRTGQRDHNTMEKKVESSNRDKPQSPLNYNPSPWRPRKKDLSYCECCCEAFTNLEEHLQSDQHRSFVLDSLNYREVDQLVDEMLPGFDLNPFQQSEETLKRPPTPLPIHDVCELELLTDAETEHAVQALKRRGSSFQTHISSPTLSPFSCGPASPPGVTFAIPNPATLPSNTQFFSLEADCHPPDVQPHALSPAMPVLAVEPQAEYELEQQPDALSPWPSGPWLLPDPYSQPPVLSPQVPHSLYVIDPYSEPPILSPQKCTNEETLFGQLCEMNTTDCVSTVPFYSPLLISVAGSNAEEESASNSESLDGFGGLVCSNRGLKCAALRLQRSRSLPRQSAVAPNPKKRCRSASPEHRHSKRRRSASFGQSGGWSEQRLKDAKQQSETIADVYSCLLFNKDHCPDLNVYTSSTSHSVTMTSSKQTCTTFSFPAAQNFSRAPDQIDSVADQPPCQLSSKAATFDPPLDISKPLCAISSQDSQRSLSHSTSVCIEPALIPDLARLSPSSSDSDWDCDLLSRLDLTSATPLTPTEPNCELDKELLHRPCPWMHDTSYESHLHTVLQPSTAAASLCAEDTDPSAFSRTVVQIVEVQH